MRLLFRPPLPVSVLFLPTNSPGLVFRAIDDAFSVKRTAFKVSQTTAFPLPRGLQTNIFLSGPPSLIGDSLPWRVLFAQTNAVTDAASTDAAQRILKRLGPELSLKLEIVVVALDISPNGAWHFTRWESGTVKNTGGNAPVVGVSLLPVPWFSFLQRGSRLPLLPSLRAWARQNKLSLDDLPLGRAWRRGANVVDFDSVAGLERKRLLVETNRVWYRVTVDVPFDETDGGIMEAP